MSEENLQKATEDNKSGAAEPERLAEESFDLVVNEATKELTVKDSRGRTLTFKPQIIEPKRPEFKPLTPEQFRDALQRLHNLGLTWTAEREPSLKAKSEESEGSFYTEEYRNIQTQYPYLPRELSAVVYHTVTEHTAPEELVGSKDDLEQKVAIVKEFVIDADFVSEFFFKRAIKVPYFSHIDWEVVFKTFERSVPKLIVVPYALLSLEFESPDAAEDDAITVAVNLELLDDLIGTLTEVKSALESTRELSQGFYKVLSESKEERHASTDDKSE